MDGEVVKGVFYYLKLRIFSFSRFLILFLDNINMWVASKMYIVEKKQRHKYINVCSQIQRQN